MRNLSQFSLLLFPGCACAGVGFDAEYELLQSLFLLLQFGELVLIAGARRIISSVAMAGICTGSRLLQNINVLITGALRTTTFHVESKRLFTLV